MNKVIVITGSSRGIGAATALQAAKQGYDVCINYRSDKASAEKIMSTIISMGRKAIAIQADVSQEVEVVRLFEAVDQTFGTLTALVNNAGMVGLKTRVEDITEARLNQMFSTNITSYFLCCREAVRRMSNKHGGKGGSIVNVSSAASRLGSANEYVDYAASKGAIDTLTIGLSNEVADEGIRVNCVRPGFIYTDIHQASGDPHRIDKMKQNIPMKRGGKPEEVANAILWLLSDEASYITGTFIDIAGGR